MVVPFGKQDPWNTPTGIYLFTGNNTNTKTICKLYSKLPTKTPERQSLKNIEKDWKNVDTKFISIKTNRCSFYLSFPFGIDGNDL